MKKLTFPHMGNLKIPAKTFFEEMGFEVICPPENSQKTLDLGMKYSPEFACLPLKINIGNFIEAMERGANTIVMGGGVGPCRFGYYGEVQKEILRDLGYDFEMICLEPQILKTYKNIRRVFGSFSWRKVYLAGKLAWYQIRAMDNIHKLVLKLRPREKEEGKVDKVYEEFLTELGACRRVESIQSLETEYRGLLEDLKGEYKRGIEIKVGIVGEIYVVIEPFTNLNVEKKLGDLGVTVKKDMYITRWIKNFLKFDSNHEEIEEAARPYLNSFVGGHGLDTIGNTVLFAEAGFDGVIQLAPFTCMPEIIAQSILPVVSERENISVLPLIFDEHTGEAGLITRLEAFVDLLTRQKKEKMQKYV